MCVNHCHFYIGMSQNFFKNKYVSTIHHEMAGECMTQHVSALALRQINTGPLYSTLKGFSARGE